MSVSALTLLAAFSASPQASPHLKPCESIPPRFSLFLKPLSLAKSVGAILLSWDNSPPTRNFCPLTWNFCPPTRNYYFPTCNSSSPPIRAPNAKL